LKYFSVRKGREERSWMKHRLMSKLFCLFLDAKTARGHILTKQNQFCILFDLTNCHAGGFVLKKSLEKDRIVV